MHLPPFLHGGRHREPPGDPSDHEEAGPTAPPPQTEPDPHPAPAPDEERLADFLRASADWLWETGPDGRLTWLSDRVTSLIGQPWQRLVGRPLAEIGTFTKGLASTAAARAMAEHRPFRGWLFELADEHGRRRQFRLSGVPVFAQDSGAFAGYRGTGTDVTTQLAAASAAQQAQHELGESLSRVRDQVDALARARAEAETALAEKRDFMAALSHEVRTPLNAIIGFGDVMRMGVFGALNPRYASYAEDIVQSGRHLLSLIDDMFDIARIENQTLKLDLEPVDVGAVLDEVVAMLRLPAEQREVDLAGAAVPPGWVVRADAIRLKQVLLNLLANAVKFSPRGARAGVAIAPAESPGGAPMLAITVWDTGRGIPENQQQRIFDKYEQGSTAPGRGGERTGLGLGLFLARHFVESMHGTIAVASRLGEGSRFTVTLPRVAVPGA